MSHEEKNKNILFKLKRLLEKTTWTHCVFDILVACVIGENMIISRTNVFWIWNLVKTW